MWRARLRLMVTTEVRVSDAMFALYSDRPFEDVAVSIHQLHYYLEMGILQILKRWIILLKVLGHFQNLFSYLEYLRLAQTALSYQNIERLFVAYFLLLYLLIHLQADLDDS